MTFLFALLFLAALVGIFKPYIGGLKRLHFALAAVVALVLVGVTAAPPDPAGAPGKAGDGKPGSPQAAAAPGEPAGKWAYSEEKDQMRGTTSRFASVRSENQVDLKFPYGVVGGTIWVRQQPKDGLDVFFQVDKGQVLCRNYSESTIAVKFDDKPVQNFRCTGSSDGSSDTAFIVDGRRALAELRKAKRTIVEAEFFQQGRQQFVFETAGLNWK